jgi:hypothetical protein
MSRSNGDRSRFNRQRKGRLHERTRIRALRQTLNNQGSEARAEGKPAPAKA